MIDRIFHAPLLAAAFVFPMSLLGDTSGTVTLKAGTELNFSTGVTGSSGGDILWSGSYIQFVNGATGYLIFGSGPLNFSLGLPDVQAYSGSFSNSSLLSNELFNGSVLLIETGGGVFGKAMITSPPIGNVSSSITMLFVSFGTGNPNAPSVGKILDAGSYGQYVAQGGVFVVKGTNLSPSGLTATSYPLPASSNGVSITFTPYGISGPATQAYIVYLYNENGVNQLAGILPSTLATGLYYVTVTTPAGASPPGVVDVVLRLPGLVTQDSTGNGLAVVQNYVSATELDIDRFTTGAVTGTPISPAHPGQTLIAWLTGMGAVPFADNSAPNGGQGYDFTKNGVAVKVLVGGMAITPFFAGRTPCCAGEDQVDFTLPANVPTGCTVSFNVQVGTQISQTVFISIAPDANSTACVSPEFNTQQLQALDNGGTASLGDFSLDLQAETGNSFQTPLTGAGGEFSQMTGFELDKFQLPIWLSTFTSGCVVYQSEVVLGGLAPPAGTIRYLDGGAVTITGPAASELPNTPLTEVNNEYYPVFFQLVPGTYTVSGAGGKDVGPFHATVTVPALLSVSNLPTSITRSQDLTLNWTGGNPSDQIIIWGRAFVGGAGAEFYCFTPAGAGGITVPSSVLEQLPAAASTDNTIIDVQWVVNGGQFTAPLTAGGSITNSSFGMTVETFSRVPYR